MEKPGIIKNDPWLEPFESVIKSRMDRLLEKEIKTLKYFRCDRSGAA